MHKFSVFMMAILLSLTLSACQSLLSNIHVNTLQQGNLITKEQIKQLHPGMSKDEVRNIIGEPILNNNLHPNRWDYVYIYEKPYHPKIEQKLTLIFKDDQLIKIF